VTDLATYLATYSERDALIDGARHHLSMARQYRTLQGDLRSARRHARQAAAYRRDLFHV
jgi:hypothetical protein